MWADFEFFIFFDFSDIADYDSLADIPHKKKLFIGLGSSVSFKNVCV